MENKQTKAREAFLNKIKADRVSIIEGSSFDRFENFINNDIPFGDMWHYGYAMSNLYNDFERFYSQGRTLPEKDFETDRIIYGTFQEAVEMQFPKKDGGHYSEAEMTEWEAVFERYGKESYVPDPNNYGFNHFDAEVGSEKVLAQIMELQTGEPYVLAELKGVNQGEEVIAVIPENLYSDEYVKSLETEYWKSGGAKELATNFVLEKLAAANIEVIADKGAMHEILEGGKLVQKMAAFHGTGGTEKSFNGYGVYVVSVNEGDAKQIGMKVASKKYGDAFYVKDQTFETFLKERKFSPYWAELLKQSRLDNVEELQTTMMLSDTKGNAELERQKNELSTLFKYGLVEHKREKAFVYSIDIPDNNGKNYLPYENPVGLENAEKINGALEKLGTQWRVTRNDGGRQIYFNTLSEKVFNGSQEEASKFLKDAGLVGMRMNDKNYIVFDEKDISVNKRVQFMMDRNGEVYGFAHGGKVYLDPDLMNANTPAHEYTHLWDAYTRQTNLELWEKGKDIFRQTRLWNEVKGDPNYADIADDEDLVLSEVHARICGDIAQRVLERMAEQDGEIARDRAIDWDKEVAEYVAGELGAEIATPELGSESYVSDSIRHEIARNFLAQPMKDLVAGKGITLKREQEETKENALSKDDLEYIRSPEFIEKFGDWEKARRLEKLKAAEALTMNSQIIVNKRDVSKEITKLRETYSRENLKSLQQYADAIGKEILAEERKRQGLNEYENPKFKNNDTEKEFFFQSMSIREIRHHNLFQKGHIEALQRIPEIIGKSVYIGKERNEDVRNSDLKNFHYFGCGIKIDGEDYTCKAVFAENKHGELFYDQSLSTIEKGKFVDLVNQKNKPVAFNPQQQRWDSNELYERNLNPFDYYDKRLINICQVPQMKYLDENLMPTKDAIEAVRAGKLHIEKNGQTEIMVDETRNAEMERIQKMATPAKNVNDVTSSERGLSEEREAMMREFASRHENAEEKPLKNLHSFSVGGQKITLDRKSGTVTMKLSGADSERMGENNFSYDEKENVWTAELSGDSTSFALMMKEELHRANLRDSHEDEITREYPASRRLYEDGWLWSRFDDGSGGLHNYGKRNYSASYDSITREGWLVDENGNNDFIYIRNGYEDAWNTEEFMKMAEESIEKHYGLERQKETVREHGKADGTEKTFTMFYGAERKPYYPEQVVSVLKEFAGIDSEKWNVLLESKPAVFHLIEVAEIGGGDFQNSVEKFSRYLEGEEYKREEENYAKILEPILMTEIPNFKSYDGSEGKFLQSEFAYDFSIDASASIRDPGLTDDGFVNAEAEPAEISGRIKSVAGNEFTGENKKITEEFQRRLVAAGIVKPSEDFVLTNELEAHARGTKVRESSENDFIILNIPVDVDGKKEFVQMKYYHVSALEEPQKIERFAESEKEEPKEKTIEIRSKNGKNSEIKIEFGKTKVPEFAMVTQNGLKTYAQMKVRGYDAESNSWTLANESGEKIVVPDGTFKELTSEKQVERAKGFSENTPAVEKMLEAQYDDFFRQRENTANNFRHNLSVYCRKEANSPLDALKVANALIKDMPAEERRRTKGLLKALRKDGETVNEVVVRIYLDAVKETPLNEEHLKANRYDKMIARPIYDTVFANGAKVDDNFDLKIGDIVNDIMFKTGKAFGIGKDRILQNCKIISASKENNMVTLIDGNKSFYDVPRDTFLKSYAKCQKREQKLSHRNSMNLDMER